MTFDVAAVRDAYKLQYPAYCKLVDVARPLLEAAIRSRLKDAVVDGRAKEPYKFVQKAIRKFLEDPDEYADPLARIGDGAGLRIIVSNLDDSKRACAIAKEIFDVLDVEDVGERYEPNELGYLGLHLQAKLKADVIDANDTYLLGYQLEIQIHTKAQNAWATVSHPLLYKPPGGQGSKTVSAKVYRAVALVSLFDEQVTEARTAMLTDPRYRPAAMLSIVQRQFLDWLQQPSDDGLSLSVLGIIEQAYGDMSVSQFEHLMEEYVKNNRERLTSVLELYRTAAEEYPLLFQPEVLAIAERLDHARQELASAWHASALPADLLSDTATALGRPI